MAPVQPSPLDLDLAKCFKGEQQLISWDTAYSALCDPETASKSAPLRNFLQAEENVEILSRPWKPFAGPSAQEKSKFESKTAPVSITPAKTAHYDLEEIKQDSLWLSKEANISEYAALRLVIQEWQSRPTVQLLSGLTEEEALSVQEAAGLSNLGSSTFVPNTSIVGVASTLGLQSDKQFDSENQRKFRILDIYHSTRIAILHVSQLLVSWGSAKSFRELPSFGRSYRVCEDWLELLGQAIANNQNQSSNQGLDQSIHAIRAKIEALNTGFPYQVPEAIYEVADENWTTAQTAELVHLLHIAIVHTDLIANGFVRAPTIALWFETISEVGFFVQFPTKSSKQEPLVLSVQLLTSLLSLAILKIDVVFNDIQSGAYENWDPSTYILDPALLENLTATFGNVKFHGPSPATPSAFAWAIITWRIIAQTNALQDERERALEFDQSSGSAPSQTSALENAAAAINKLQESDLFDKKPPYQDIAEVCSGFNVLDMVTKFSNLGMRAFGTPVDRISRDRFRLLYLHLIRAALGSNVVMYSPELIICAHAIMTGDRTFRSWTEEDASRHADPIVAFFLADDILREQLLDEARWRYPYETTPFLKFSSALTRGEKTTEEGVPTVVQDLIKMNTLMQRLPEGFKDYYLIREEENANYVALSVDLPQFIRGRNADFAGSQRLMASGPSSHFSESDESMVIPAATEGNIVDDSSMPYVAIWNYHHSALEYLVQLLSTYTVGSIKVETANQEPAPQETVIEIIGFFADLVHSSLQTSRAQGDGNICSPELLSALNIGVDGNQDTVNIILSIFEEELLRLCQEPSNEGSLELVVSCTQFLEALIVIAPNRVWPWLARSRLLENDGNGGSLATILVGTELVLGRYDFLIGCIRIYKALVNDAVERSIARQSSSRALTRFNAATISDSGASDKIMSTLLLTFGRTLASIYESSLSWKYNRVEDRLEINIGICEVFKTILEFAYGVDDAPKLSSKLTRLIAPIAEYITELYLTKSVNDLPTNPILASLLTGANLDKQSLLTSSAVLWKQQTRATLLFSDILVRVANLLKKPWTHFEQQLFKATPLLSRLYATSDVWKSPVVLLLETLVRGAVRVMDDEETGSESTAKKENQEPPSLLGHLGSRTAKNFLSVLSQLDEPLRVVDIQTNVWSLLSAVVTCKQQWFSLYLLTGNTPRETVRAKADAASNSGRNKALLSRALDSLSHLDLEAENRPWPLYIAMLEFVASAQNNWSWAMGDLQQHKDFIKSLLEFLKWMARHPRVPKGEKVIIARSHQNKFASLACEVIAMHLHASRQRGDVAPLKDVVPSLAYLEDSALDIPSYNVSLHTNLKQNLEKKFAGVTLANFKRTTLYPETFGESFFYDVSLADKVLRFDASWKNSNQGFSAEIKRANTNLGLVESQVQLLHSWKLLALELSFVVAKDDRLAKILIKVVRDCMRANAKSMLPEALFGQLMILRADLAFALLKKLAEAQVKAPEARALLASVWDAIRECTSEFDTVYSSESVNYYRSLLRILYLSLQFHLLTDSDSDEEASLRSSFRGAMQPKDIEKKYVEPISSLLLEILSKTVADGFRSLATQLHSDPATVYPSDFALLTAIFQQIINIPEMAKWQGQATLLFTNSNTIRYATSLFSWSDRLAISHNGIDDPVYGELSLLFILSLSTMQPLAEAMAVEGILSQLNTANLMKYYRKPGGMGPLDAPHRLFSIWTKGILPLCLNLLLHVQHPVAPEVASFLNQYPEQLSRASNALNSRIAPKITLSLASEVHSLALLSSILDDMREKGPRLGIQATDIEPLEWDKENVKEDIDGWMARKGSLRERVVVLDEREAELYARRAGADADGNELEERVIVELEAAGAILKSAKAEGSVSG